MTDMDQTVSTEEYKELQKELETAQQQNRRLQKLISLGSVSTLSTLIDQYLAFSQAQFKKIAQEIQLTDYSRDNVEKVLRLLEHLEHARKELHVFIDLHEEGIAELNPGFQKCLFAGEATMRELEGIGTLLDMTEEQAEALLDMLEKFRGSLSEMVESIREEHP